MLASKVDEVVKNQHEEVTEDYSDSSERFLMFKLSNELFACDLREICEVVKIRGLTPVPFAKPSVAGVINLRGRIVSLVDIRKKLGLKQFNSTQSLAIVAERDGKLVAGLIDELLSVSVVTGQDQDDGAVPNAKALADHSRGVAKIDGHIVRILSCESLFFNEDMTL
ncbi:MAG: chemotaxis protein CheW [Proteobacteria bacterium]|nr:chemotaxis protein CheW [Pseudomonadota bacterium]